MGFRCGIVGLPNVGKSTLFNALTETQAAQAANYPFCTIEPNEGRVAVPDDRLSTIAQIGGSAKIIETQLSFVDIAGLVRGASKGEGLGNQFLANIREVDAIVHVLRCFEDDDITHVEGKVDPIADADTVETELMLADLESLEKRVPNLAKKAAQGDKEAKAAASVLGQALDLLRDGKPARLTVPRDPEEERAEYLEALGLTEAGLARIIRAGYELLGLITFFTVGPKEARAWTVAKGSKAPQAAGAIHTDFEKGFIRAETMAYADYVQYKGEAGAKEAGKWRSEGKDYVTQDGDIMLFRFNV